MTATLDTDILPATAGDIPRLARVLTAAFADNPVSDWLFDGEQDRHHPAFFTAFLHWAIKGGLVEQTLDGTGVAVWIDYTTPPDPQLLTRFDTGVVAAAGGHELRWRTFDKATTAIHPRTPHWWLAFLGVHPAHRGRGHATHLLHSAAQWLGDTPVYLEATSRSLTRFYHQHGFQPAHHIVVPRGPVLYGMHNPGPDRSGSDRT